MASAAMRPELLPAGLAFGLAAGFVMSLAYVFSRVYLVRGGGHPIRLLVLSHVLIGIACTALLPLIWPANMPPLGQYFWQLLGTSGFYMVGQGGFFLILRNTDASRAAPLLGMKLLFLAIISVVFLNQQLAPQQWVAIGLTMLAAWLLNTAGVRLGWRVLCGIAAVCMTYSGSDLSIVAMTDAMGDVPRLRASLVGFCLSYVLCGIVAVAMLPWAGSRSPGEWRRCLPFSATWFIAMACLFACFASIGAVLGNIMQSTRGLFSVLMGAMLVRWGMVDVERAASRAVLIRRAIAAALMILAIALYLLKI